MDRYNQRKQKSLKWRAFLSGLILALSLTGCGASGSAPGAEPPALQVTAGKTKIQAIKTTFSWQNGNIGTEADGLHPLDMAEDLPVLEVPKDGAASLAFKTAPDQVTVLAWKASAAGTGAYGDPEFSLPVSGEYTVTLPANDRYLYQVHAVWKIRDEVGGDAYYGFATVPKG